MFERDVERTEVAVIGAGQSGLTVGYHLKKAGIPFVMLDANERIGHAWRSRWDSLLLNTPARFDGLPGMPFPARASYFPTKDEMADYLESYAARFQLPVRTGVRVDRLSRRGPAFVVSAGGHELEASQVVVAMSSYQRPVMPAFAGDLRPDIMQVHSLVYRNPSQLRPGRVLVVGAANSGAEIAMDLRRAGREVTMAGRHPGHVPFRIDTFIATHIVEPILFRIVFHRILTLDTRFGRKLNPPGSHPTAPLIRLKPRELDAAGVRRVPRVTRVEQGLPVLETGESVDVENVVWCTGFDPGFSWIDLPVFDEHGDPKHRRGIVESAPGLYFTGLHFLYAMSSTMIQGVARDAGYVASAVVEQARSTPAVASEARRLLRTA